MEVEKGIGKRNSSIELLRIIMMLQIIFLHVCEYGNFYQNAVKMGGNHALLYWVTWLMCRCPVFMFIIIMGYFMCDSKSGFNVKRILKVYIPMYVYAICIPLFVIKTGIVGVEKYDVARAFFPFFSRTWYFMTLYLLVLILSPFLNKLIQNLSKKDYLMLLGILFIIFSVWQALAQVEPFNAIFGIKKIIDTDGGKSLYDFVFMYLLGGYLKHYKIRPEGTFLWWKNWMNLVMYILLGLINVSLVYAYPEIKSVIAYNDNMIAVLQCIFLFRFFAEMEFHSETINFISSCNLGIYMIHEHPLLREFIWDKVFDFDKTFYSNHIYVLFLILTIICVYCGCGVIELTRQGIGYLLKRIRG